MDECIFLTIYRMDYLEDSSVTLRDKVWYNELRLDVLKKIITGSTCEQLKNYFAILINC